MSTTGSGMKEFTIVDTFSVLTEDRGRGRVWKMDLKEEKNLEMLKKTDICGGVFIPVFSWTQFVFGWRIVYCLITNSMNSR